MGRRGFAVRLALVAAAGVALRVLYALVVVRDGPLGIDAVWYQLQGSFISDGRGVIDPAAFFQDGRSIPTASFPPLFPTVLAVAQWAGVRSITGLRLVGLVPATATIVLTGVLARRVFGDERVGLVAAALVAASPMVIATDGSLMSETVTVPLTLVVLLLLDRLRADRGPLPLALVGLVSGIGALARMDLASVGLIGTAAVLLSVRADGRRVLVGTAVVAVVIAATLAPWVLRNQRALDTPTVATASVATALAGANCDPSYGGEGVGAWTFACLHEEERTLDNEVAWSDGRRAEAGRYVRAHLRKVPLVAGARVLRVWGLWDPRDALPREAEESRRLGWQRLAWAVGLPVLALAVAALVVLRRRWRSVVVLLVPLLAVTLTAVVTYGNARFRAPAEPVLAILAAWMLVQLAARWRGRAAPV